MTGQTTEGARDRPSWDVPVELLVVLGPGTGVPAPPPGTESPEPGTTSPPPPTRPLTALEALRRLVSVTLDCPPRLALIPLPPHAAGRIAEQPYVVGVYTEAPPPAVVATLSLGEQLFVDAWLLRVEDRAYRRKRHRHGDRLPWDAPGHEPPDPPGSAVP
ncbi:hypothetical protein [Pseudofrankia asymbiotica]|uniref:Uncharacterized protein n=1 Tax=Pseudofrankia asymbiotica TaxID=1834516 RepID=A0A1V2IE49_9ACTN|nr:hypothetical protein [Pseudofrankia asymbiotica]ONH31397.1 hypothetical protein BL253_09060 [Pseudofrankia asymbiotica]